MMPFGARARLIDALGSLAGYNDKGFEWSGHDAAQVKAHRASAMDEVVRLVEAIGRDRLPTAFVEALDRGAVAEDASGAYVAMVRRDR
jgi:hypothetical protein